MNYSDLYNDACRYMMKDSPSIQIKLEDKGKPSMFRNIPQRLARLLSVKLKALYRLGWVDEDLDITDTGKLMLLEWLYDKFESEFGDFAKKTYNEAKAKEDAEK